jgi:Ca-activated chloride channel family protein
VRFTVRADRQLIRAGARSRRFLLAEIQAPEAPNRPGRLPVNLAFVLDRSGSMGGEKIAHAREAVLQGIGLLRDEDRFAVVAYDDHVQVVVPTTVATAEAREAASRAVARIAPRGSTDLEGGWRRGCEQVLEHLSAEAVGRCLLLTDGLANAGVTDHAEIERRLVEWRGRRVVTSTFGVGAHFDETLLRRMADAGGGSYEFIESAAQIADFMASEVGEALAVTAREAVLVVEAGEGAVVESLNDFRCRKDGSAWRVEIGSLFGGQSRNPVLRVTLPEGEVGAALDVTVRLEDADGVLGRPTAVVRFTGASHEENDRQPRDRTVDRRVAALYAAKAERDALERNRAGDYAAARRILERCVDRIGRYAGDDREILAVSEDLRGKVPRYSDDMDGLTRKTLHSLSSRGLKERYMEKERRLRRPPAKVSLLASHRLGGLLDPVIAHLAAADPDLFGDLALDVVSVPWADGAPLDPAEEAQVLDDVLAGAPSAAVRILFTPRRLSDNWFSHWHGSRGAAIVSLDGWDGSFGVPAEAFVAYEVIQHGLRLLGPAWEPERLAHAETRGCLFDFCAHRSDVDIKLQAADFCPSCHSALVAAGLPMNRLQRLAEVVRTLAVPARVVH